MHARAWKYSHAALFSILTSHSGTHVHAHACPPVPMDAPTTEHARTCDLDIWSNSNNKQIYTFTSLACFNHLHVLLRGAVYSHNYNSYNNG